MRLYFKIIIFCVICLLFAQGITAHGRGLIKITSSKSGDAYLVVQFALILLAYEYKLCNKTIEVSTPVGFLMDNMYLQEYSENVYCWNKVNGRIITIIKKNKMKSYYQTIETNCKLNNIKQEYLINEFMGINNLCLSTLGEEMIQQYGAMLAEVIGINCQSTGVLNLYGVLCIQELLGSKNCDVSSHSKLRPLYEITEHEKLIKEIGKCSRLIDIAAYWNVKFIFYDLAHPICTLSGYKIGPFIGDKKLVRTIRKALVDVLTPLSPEKTKLLLSQILEGIATTTPMAPRYAILFNQTTDPIDDPLALGPILALSSLEQIRVDTRSSTDNKNPEPESEPQPESDPQPESEPEPESEFDSFQ